MAQCVLHDPDVRSRYERIVPIRRIDADPEQIVKIGAERLASFRTDAAGRMGEAMAGGSDPEWFRQITRRTGLDDALLDRGWLRGATGLGQIEFFYIVACVEDAIRRDPEAPLFRNGIDPDRASSRGNRCILAAEHVLCMFLFYMWTGCAQDALQLPFKVDQSTASRNIRTIRRILAGTNVLPTDLVTMDETGLLTPEEFRRIIGRIINLDCTHVVIEAPGDKASNDEAFSGKEHATTCKKLHGCTPEGIVVLGGPWVGGRGSEIEYLRTNLPDIGHLTASMTSPDTPAALRITANFDGGPQGVQDVLPGANVRMPYRRPPGGELAPDQLAYNSWLAGERAIIENNFADIKAHGILGNRFRGSVQDLEETGHVAVGLVNLKRIMRRRRGYVPDTHRKTLKSGPKKPGPRGRKPQKTFEYLEPVAAEPGSRGK